MRWSTDALDFVRTVIAPRSLKVLPIAPAIADIAVSLQIHGDPADRIIAATAIYLDA